MSFGSIPILSRSNESSVAMNTEGDFVVTWQSSSFTIFGQRYDAAGVAKGSQFKVNTTETHSFQRRRLQWMLTETLS